MKNTLMDFYKNKKDSYLFKVFNYANKGEMCYKEMYIPYIIKIKLHITIFYDTLICIFRGIKEGFSIL